jgi:selenide,water dikinase
VYNTNGFLSKYLLWDHVLLHSEKGCFPSGVYANKNHFGQWANFASAITDVYKMAMFDPQTSGVLLLAVSQDKAYALINALKKENVLRAAIVGAMVRAKSLDKTIEVY